MASTETLGSLSSLMSEDSSGEGDVLYILQIVPNAEMNEDIQQPWTAGLGTRVVSRRHWAGVACISRVLIPRSYA
jgi:hypothetical protein